MKSAPTGRRRFLLRTAAGAAASLVGARAVVAVAPRAAPAVRAGQSQGPSAHALRYYRTAAY